MRIYAHTSIEDNKPPWSFDSILTRLDLRTRLEKPPKILPVDSNLEIVVLESFFKTNFLKQIGHKVS
jgi:hypothetical protein